LPEERSRIVLRISHYLRLKSIPQQMKILSCRPAGHSSAFQEGSSDIPRLDSRVNRKFFLFSSSRVALNNAVDFSVKAPRAARRRHDLRVAVC
jgi:hypothetical protein